MPELRCPMCGKLNAETAEVCVYCQARLRPLTVPPSEPEPPPPASTPPGAGPGDWLERLRAQGSAGEPGGTRDLSGEAEPLAGPEEVPNWLARIRTRGEEEEATPVKVPPPAPEHVPPPSPPKASAEPEGELEGAEEPEWLKRLRVRRAYEQEQEPPVSPFGAPTPVRGEELPPDWLHEPREEGWPAPGPGTPPGTQGKGQPTPSEAETSAVPAAETASPQGPPPSPEKETLTPFLAGVGEPPSPGGQPKSGLPRLSPFTLGSEEVTGEETEEEVPEWLARVRELAEPTLPEGQAPAQLQAEEGAAPGLDELLAPGVLPEWLTATQPSTSGPPTESEAEEIEHAVLPPWLQALRPIEGPAVKAEGGEEERVETAGPLSGLKGVLPPISLFEKIPHPPVQREQLEIDPAHAAQAELLQRVVINPEAREMKRGGRAGRRFPFWTWGVWVLLLIAILAPAVAQTHVFARPATVSVETLKVQAAIKALPDDRPVLMAFEYDPADAAEMGAGALAVVGQIMGRGIPIAVLSTRPAGPALAAEVIARGEAEYPDYASAGKYLSLGYLPGDAVGLRAFASDPRKASSAMATSSVWDSAFLKPVTSLEGFSSIVLVVAQPQLFQAWIEQVHTLHPGVPVFAVISAAAEPLVRPYYESDHPSVEGLVVGLAGAETYACMESTNPATGQCGSISPADTWWDPFGASVLMAVLVLGVGALASVGSTLVQRTGEKRRD